MKIKRLVCSLSASFDQFVSSVENHDAVAENVLKELRECAAQIRTELHQLHSRLLNLEKQKKNKSHEFELWKKRAIDQKDKDETKALRCVDAMQSCESFIEELDVQIQESSTLKSQVESHLVEVEKKLYNMQQKRLSLRARQARNKSVANCDSVSGIMEGEDLFSRWEQSVVANEYNSQVLISPIDENYDQQKTLDELFKTEEKENELKNRLAMLSPNQGEV